MRNWLGVQAGVDAPRLPDDVARRLLRLEEYESQHRDQWGNWEFGACEAFREGRLWEPDVDRWVAERRRELQAATAVEPLWPDGRPFAVCLTHDVDLLARASTPRQALRSMRASLAGGASTTRDQLVRLARPGVRAARALHNGISLAPDAETLERSVAIERERGVTASYFFTVWPQDVRHRYDCTYAFDDPVRFRGERVRIRDVVRTLHDESFDVGLHGSYNSALVPGMLAREKAALEDAGGFAVTTTRQHFVHWDVRTTPHLQAGAGLRADSSLAFNRNIGFRAGTSLPFRLFDVERGDELDLIEVPLLLHDGALFRADALELDVPLAREVLWRFFDRIESVGGVLTVIVHPNNLERPEYEDLFRETIERGLERGAWFASLADIDRWWRDREARFAA